MSVLDVVLIIIGAVLVIASYVFTEKKAQKTDKNVVIDESTIKSVLEEKLLEAKSQIENAAQVSAQMVSEKTEHELDTVSNLKMQALNEYSEQVLEQISKNHNEVMFLYGMLNDKQNELNATLDHMTDAKDQTEQMLKSFETIRQEAAEVMQREENMRDSVEKLVKQAENVQMSIQAASSFVAETFNKVEPEKKEAIMAQDESAEHAVTDQDGNAVGEAEVMTEIQKEEEKPKKKTVRRSAGTATKSAKSTAARKKSAVEQSEIKEAPEMDIQFDPSGQDGANKNERILELHKKGKSNMDIAKELGLGLGEVKLVIDLFEGVK